MKVFHLFFDALGTANDATKDYLADESGQPIDLAPLSNDVLKFLNDTGAKVPDWVSAALIEQALQLAFQFIKSKKPAA